MLTKIDKVIITISRRIDIPLARFVIFFIFFWFGILKPLGVSSATPLVKALLAETLPFLSFSTFFFYFGLFEIFIGLSFLIPNFEREAIALLIIHMIMTFLPLFFLPNLVWKQPFVPTLEGQYILKNLAFITLSIILAAHIKRKNDFNN